VPFRRRASSTWALEQILRTGRDEQFAIVVYCFMPDHLHLLVEGTGAASDLRRFIKLAKQHSGFLYRRNHNQPLWQEGYDDRVLRNDEHTIDVARYILANPVRAGLVASPAEYPFSGSDVFPMEVLLEDTQSYK